MAQRFTSPLPPDALLDRLESAAGKEWRLKFRRRDQTFTLRRRGSRNSFRPTFRGRVIHTSQGSVIEGDAPTPSWAVWFARIWWIVAVLIGLAGLMVAFSTPVNFLLPLILMPVFGVLILGVLVNAGQKEAEELSVWLAQHTSPTTGLSSATQSTEEAHQRARKAAAHRQSIKPPR